MRHITVPCIAILSVLSVAAQDRSRPITQESIIYVVGNVASPGSYPFLDGSGRPATLLTAIALAKGFSSDSGQNVYIYRSDGNGARHEISVAVRDVLGRRKPDVNLLAGDIVYVPLKAGPKPGQPVPRNLDLMNIG